jgi:hypothetical protein
MKLSLVLIPLLLAGCSEKLARVKLLDRDIHGKPVMADVTDPLHHAMTEHAYFSREGSYGGGGIGGGGCGCN